MITLRKTGDFSKLNNFLEKAKRSINVSTLNRYGEEGVAALSAATPIDSSLTANSWGYRIETMKTGVRIVFTNSNIQNGVPIAIILQYGHATRNGGFVQGIDYINPAIKPVFDKIAENAWREVISK